MTAAMGSSLVDHSVEETLARLAEVMAEANSAKAATHLPWILSFIRLRQANGAALTAIFRKVERLNQRG